MARDFTTIYNSIVSTKNTYPQLDVISLTSQVSIASLWIAVVAEAIRIVETFFDTTEADINAKIAAQITGTASWYKGKCFEFQLGDTLQTDGTYAVVDASKQIITRAAVVENSDGTLTIKVAKGNVGVETGLSSTELVQFTTYMQRVKFAGVKINPISLNADQLKIVATVYHDGIYSTSVMQTNVIAALNNYLATGLTFNGNILTNHIIDAVQAVQGVYDIQITDISAIVGVVTYPIDREYQTFSGYAAQASGTGNTFIETLTFTPMVTA